MRISRITLIVLAIALTACSETALEPRPEPRFNQASSGFPVVFVTTRTPHAAQANAPRFANLRDAIEHVRPAGTIMVEDGDWETDGVIINKPLTMKPAHATRPVLKNSGTGTGLTIDGVAAGTVELIGLKFLNAAGLSAVRARGTYDRVMIRDAQVEVTAAPAGSGTALGINATASSVPGAQVVVENTTFVGGRFCAISQGATAHVRNSHFEACSVAAVQYTLRSRGTIENNQIEGCGTNACISLLDPDGVVVAGNQLNHPGVTERSGIRATGSTGGDYVTIDNNQVSGARSGIVVIRASGRIAGNSVGDCGELCIFADQPPGAMMIENNRVSVRVAVDRVPVAERPWVIGIMGSSQEPAGRITIRNNDVEGNLGTGPAAIATIGIQAMSWNPQADRGTPGLRGSAVEIFGNRVTDVQIGMQSVNGGSIDARDNVVNGTMRSLNVVGVLAVMRANRNDILNSAVFAIAGNGSIDARCNWWGSAGGPGNAAVPAAVYTPFATVPIANRPGVVCP